jgi:hypothetical protein
VLASIAMRIVLLATALAAVLGCGPNDAEEICRKDAQRWGECVGDLLESQELGTDVQQTLESKIDHCATDQGELTIARACHREASCEAWIACWTRRGAPPR